MVGVLQVQAAPVDGCYDFVAQYYGSVCYIWASFLPTGVN